MKPESFIQNVRSLSTFLFSTGKLKSVTSSPYHNHKGTLKERASKSFDMVDYFDMYTGKYYPKDSFEKGTTPLIASSDNNNGLMCFTNIEPLFKNSITIGKKGMPVYYQPIQFVANPDVIILAPLFEMNSFSALYITSLLRMDKYKWAYDKQISLDDVKKLSLKLPINKEEQPDWQFMEYYIKSLPYSSNLKTTTSSREKGLCDSELVAKYESGEIDFGKVLGRA